MTVKTIYRTFEKTTSIEAKAQEVMEKLERFAENSSVTVTFDSCKGEKQVEVKVTAPRKEPVICSVKSDNLYDALDEVQEKAIRILRKRKEKDKSYNMPSCMDDALLEEQQLQEEMLALA